MRRIFHLRNRNNERGVTMAIVALALVTLIGVAALAIDVVTLYASKAEAQSAADAAALAGAKSLMDAGVTSDPSDSAGNWTNACLQASTIATEVAQQNKIAGQNLAPGGVNVCFPNGTGGNCGACAASSPTAFGVNPQVRVTITRTDLPLFFAKIWGQQNAGVSAFAIAEGFNPSGTNIPVAPKCVKPWLVPNYDPLSNQSSPTALVNAATGAIVAPPSLLGQQIQLQNCDFANGNCTGPPPLPQPPAQIFQPALPTAGGLRYYPLDIPVSTNIRGPSCWNPLAATSYEENVEACNPAPIACGSNVNVAQVLRPDGAGHENQRAVPCMINALGPGINAGQDTLNTSTYPFQFEAGSNNPLVQAGSLSTNDQISQSSSVVTIPIYQPAAGLNPPAPANPVQVVGFLQVFVDRIRSANRRPVVSILNVIGCSPGSYGQTPVVGSGLTPVPVRLIRN